MLAGEPQFGGIWEEWDPVDMEVAKDGEGVHWTFTALRAFSGVNQFCPFALFTPTVNDHMLCSLR